MMRAHYERNYSRTKGIYDRYGIRSGLNQVEYFAGAVPIMGDILRAADRWTYYNDRYFPRHNMSWADVKAPASLSNGGLSGAVSGAWRVSKNVWSLYH